MTNIHPTALVDKGAEIDSTVEIGPYSVIGSKVRIGAGTRVESHVVIQGKTTIGEGNVFFPFSNIGGVPQDLKYKGEDTELIIGNHNRIRECVTLNLGTVQGGGFTKIGDHNLLMSYMHVGHDTIIGSHCIFGNSLNLAGHVIVQDHSNIGGMSGVSQFLRIGEGAYVTAITGVEKEVPPFAIAHGLRPCNVRGANIIGMRRRGYPNESIQAVSESLKIWTDENLTKDQALEKMRAQYGSIAEVQKILHFIESSESGVLR
jgi:UDP-N-acetylglucosamine acyltransferase